MQLELLKEGDWAGIVTMAIGLSALQTVLEEGNKDDWFASPFILRLAVVAVVFLSLFVWIELTVEKPLVNLRLLKGRNFGIGVVAPTLVGFALFGSVYVLPQYLGQVQRYNAEQIGKVLAWTGLPQLLLIPLVPLLMKRFDVRYIAFTGLAIFAMSCFMNIDDVARLCRRPALDAEHRARHRPGPGADAADRDHHRPASRRRTPPPPPASATCCAISAAPIGTATLATIITKREQFHSNIIGQSVTLYRDEVRQRIAQLTNYFIAHGVPDPAAAQHQAIVALGKAVKRQALVMGFSDTFAVIGVVLVLAALAVALTRKAKAAAAGGAH